MVAAMLASLAVVLIMTGEAGRKPPGACEKVNTSGALPSLRILIFTVDAVTVGMALIASS